MTAQAGGGVGKACWQTINHRLLRPDNRPGDRGGRAPGHPWRGSQHSTFVSLGSQSPDCVRARLSGSLADVPVRLVEPGGDGVRIVFTSEGCPLGPTGASATERGLPNCACLGTPRSLCSEGLIALLPQEGSCDAPQLPIPAWRCGRAGDKPCGAASR